MIIALSLFAIFLLLIFTDLLWRRGKLEPETARKIIHIFVGLFIAFWPLYMSWTTIQLLSIALLIGVFLSYEFGIFGAIHKVKRRTGGELFYPVGIGLTAVFTNQPWIFCVAILHLALADGLAAIVGTKWGLRHYQIGQHTKSILGSLAFFVTSFGLCIFAFIVLSHELPGISLGVFMLTPFLATAIESISRHGIDNILIPMAVIFALGLPTGTLLLNI